MRTHLGQSVSWGLASGAIMVQVQHSAPLDTEWDEMLEAIRSVRADLVAIVIVVSGKDRPSPTQRKKIAELAATYPATFRGVALFTDSLVVRGALTAIRWLVPTKFPTHAFASSEIEQGLDALRLDARQKSGVRDLLAVLTRSGSSASSP